MKFLIDMRLSPTLAVHAVDLGLHRAPDTEIIARAKLDARTVVRLSDLLARLSEADIAQSILVVDRDRVRRRRLPIA